MDRRRALAIGIAGGVVTAAVAAINRNGARIRRKTDPRLDALLADPDDVIRHRLDLRDGGNLLLVESGLATGRPIVCLHGVTLGWRVWNAVMRLAGDTHRVLAWDMRGHGESHAGSAGVSIGAAAGDLAEALEQLDLRDAIVIGHSMGGMVLMQALMDEPAARERVSGAMFVATSPAAFLLPGLEKGVGLVGASVGGAFVGGLTRGPMVRYPDTNASAAMIRLVFGDRVTATMVNQVREMLAGLRRETAREAGRAILSHDVRGRLGEITTPSTVVVGDKDLLTPPVHARILLGGLPDADLTLLPGVGHQVMQEAPEDLMDLVLHLEKRL